MSKLFPVALLLLTVPLHAESAGKYVENGRWGFKMRIPRDWEPGGVDAAEMTLAARHLGKRELRPKKQLWIGSRPELSVFGFPRGQVDDVFAAYRQRIERPGSGKPDLLSDETRKKVRRVEMRLSGPAVAPTRIVAWIYRFEDIDFVLEGRVLEDHYRSYDKLFQICFKSFARIERSEALPGASAGPAVDSAQAEIDALPEGWTYRETKHYLLLSNADAKFTGRAGKHAEAIRAYVEDQLGSLAAERASDKPGIIRVFSAPGQEQAYRQKSPDLLYASNEVLVSKGEDFGDMNMRLLAQWLKERNAGLADQLPDWMRKGLQQHLRFMATRGGRARFKPDAYNRGQLRDAVKSGRMMPLRKLFLESGRDDLVAATSGVPGYGVTFDDFTLQAGSVVSWLLTKGNRGRTKGLLVQYVGHLLGVIEEVEKKSPDAGPLIQQKEGESREELLKRARARQAALDRRRGDIARRAFEKTFEGYTDADWERLDKAWQAYAK